MKGTMKGFGGLIEWALGITVLIILASSVILPQVFTANQTGWDTGTVAVWGIIGLAVAAYIILAILG